MLERVVGRLTGEKECDGVDVTRAGSCSVDACCEREQTIERRSNEERNEKGDFVGCALGGFHRYGSLIGRARLGKCQEQQASKAKSQHMAYMAYVLQDLRPRHPIQRVPRMVNMKARRRPV